jgi:hypothetical protein
MEKINDAEVRINVVKQAGKPAQVIAMIDQGNARVVLMLDPAEARRLGARIIEAGEAAREWIGESDR